MANRVCENCETTYDRKLDFCPKCGMYNVELEEQVQQIENAAKTRDDIADKCNPSPQATIEEMVGRIDGNISTIKSIMVFFTWLWGISVLIVIIALITNA